MKKHLLLLLFVFSAIAAHAQKITGVVTDSDSNPILGASVTVENSPAIGTTTNVDGSFELNGIKSQDVLVFSYIGYATQEVAVGSRTSFNIVMESTAVDMDDVVVIGYGTQKKALLTGANANVDGDAIAEMKPSSAMEALQGVVPGLSITRNSGSPGAGTIVTIRGMGTIGDSSPLYIVDGVSVSDINYLNPSDIESIDVLKDAASAAIYGSRAANGVVLVTTKKGKASADGTLTANVTYDGYLGIQNAYKQLETLNAQEYMFIIDEARSNDGLTAFDWESMVKNNSYLSSTFGDEIGSAYGEYVWNMLENGWEGTNWVDEITNEDAIIQSHAVNITGGAKDFVYAAGFSYYDQEGIIGGDIIGAGYTRITARLNSEVVLFKNSQHNILTFGENITYTNTVSKSTANGNIYYNDLHAALVATPLMPAYWDNEGVAAYTNGFAPNLDGIDVDQLNPLAEMYYNRNFSEGGSNNIIGNVYAELEPIKNLKIRSSFGVSAWFGNNRSYSPEYSMGSLLSSTTTSASMNMWQGSSNTWTNTATYDFTINDDHEFSALIGTEMVKTVYNGYIYGYRQNMLFDGMDYAYLDNADTVGSISEVGAYGADYAASGGGLMSYMSRLSYNYKGKYMADATLRADGSSNFAEGNRWGYFPSLSAGWNFSEEDFMQDNRVITTGKLRASWGQNGNQNISNFVYLSNVEYKDQGYYFGSDKDVPGVAAVPSNVSNPDVTWETSEQLNIGVDLRMFHSRMGVTFDWYNKMTKDWLVEAPIMGTYGADAPYINGGDVRNRGVELAVSWNDRKGDFTYSATLSLAHNKNEVTRIANEEGVITGTSSVIAQNTSYVSRVEVGMPIGYFYGYETAGIFQNQAECDQYVGPDGSQIQVTTEEGVDRKPGDVIFVDQNNDGIIDDNDKVMIGDPNADFELGFQLNLGYKNFYLNTTLTGKFGQQVMQSYRSFTDQMTENYTTAVFDRWHGEGTSNTMPRLSYNGNANTNLVSDIYVQDADYLRVSSLTFGYNLDSALKNLTNNAINGGSVYCTVNNLYTFTGYDGMDPEIGYGGGDSWASGIDLGLYPLARTVIFGVNLTF
ncbi:MAG: TonB-dependent receptor [Rikenellaceae bacterium]